MRIFIVFTFLIFTLIGGFAQIPSGYYNSAAGLSGSSLKTALYNIVKNHTVVSYTNLWSAYYDTDARADGKVWDIYTTCSFTFGTDQDAGTGGTAECQKYNREHTMPQSYFNEDAPMVSDLFHVYPTDKFINGERGNLPYGEVSVATLTSSNGCKKGSSALAGFSGTVFEPVDSFKGDIARTYFYMATRYENVLSSWTAYTSTRDDVMDGTSYPAFDAWFITMLLEWNTLDPVSQKEIDRNNVIYNDYQHNRNPFIDHPEYANQIWSAYAPVSPEPSNHAANFSADVIKLDWVDAVGATAPDGYLIKYSTIGFGSIPDPVDGTPVSDGVGAKNVSYGVEHYELINPTQGQTYYFKIFPYTGSGANINYKTDGAVQQVSVIVN